MKATHPIDGASVPGLPASADVLARAAGENFSVAPWFLPRAQRRDLMALYGFARLVDWIGDEAEGDRSRMLDWADAELDSAAVGAAEHPLFRRLSAVIGRHSLELQPFHDLIEANRRDQTVHHYPTFEDLLGYCALSANPVGRMVLGVLGEATAERVAWSDDVCTALQLVEHWQDVGEDARAGRVYLPADDLERFGCAESDLLAATATPQVRALIRFECARARGLLGSGIPLAASLRGRSRVLLTGFVAGGQAALDAIEAAGGEVLGHRCRPARRRVLAHTARALGPRRRARHRARIGR